MIFFFNWRNSLSNDYIVAKKCNLKKIRQDILRSLLSLLCLYLSAHLLFLYLCMCLFMYVLVYMCLFMWLCILHFCIVHVWMCMWIMNSYLLLCLCVCAYEYERHISDPASIRPRRHQRVHWKIGFAGKKYVPLGTVTESTGKNHIPVGTRRLSLQIWYISRLHKRYIRGEIREKAFFDHLAWTDRRF